LDGTLANGSALSRLNWFPPAGNHLPLIVLRIDLARLEFACHQGVTGSLFGEFLLIIDLASIRDSFNSLNSDYVNAQPFPHIALEGLFDLETLRAIESEFPSAEKMGGRFTGEIEGGKFAESDSEAFGPITQEFVAACNSGPFLNALSALTGIAGLIPDPYLAGGGQHQTGRGGRLKVHSDFNVHPFLNLTRRLNMLIYLNEDWDPSWGGKIELWNKDMTQAEVAVTPVLGQVVIFSTTDISYHGLPDPIECPPGRFRRSLAFYYFTADETTPEARSTLWKERPDEDFLTRPSARIKAAGGHIRRAFLTLAGK